MAGHVARMGRREMHTAFWWAKLKERNHLEDLELASCKVTSAEAKRFLGKFLF
jgi:hypothetical protein